MNFMLKAPSLEHMISLKIAITLWSQVDVREFLVKLSIDFLEDCYDCAYLEYKWQETEDKVVEKASKFDLPELLKKRLVNNIQPIGWQIFSWIRFHCCFGDLRELPAVFAWTPDGTINRKRTAEVMVKDETLDKTQRFLWACYYCLEDDIDLRPENNYTFYLNYSPLFPYISIFDNEDFRLKQVIVDPPECFQIAANHGNEAAIRYFCFKLSSQNTEQLRLESAKRIAMKLNKELGIEDYTYIWDQQSDTLFFLMSTLNVEQQEEIFNNHTYVILKSFLVWPRQSLFLEMAKDKLNFLSHDLYCKLLHDIVDRMSRKRSYLRELFSEFWRKTPKAYKQYLTDEDLMGNLFRKLYKKDCDEIVQLILNDSSITARKNLISSHGQDICIYLVCYEKWNSIEHLIQECISSLKEMIAFKEQFKLVYQSYVQELN